MDSSDGRGSPRRGPTGLTGLLTGLCPPSLHTGPVVSEIRQVIQKGTMEQVFRLYEGADTLEIAYAMERAGL